MNLCHKITHLCRIGNFKKFDSFGTTQSIPSPKTQKSKFSRNPGKIRPIIRETLQNHSLNETLRSSKKQRPLLQSKLTKYIEDTSPIATGEDVQNHMFEATTPDELPMLYKI